MGSSVMPVLEKGAQRPGDMTETVVREQARTIIDLCNEEMKSTLPRPSNRMKLGILLIIFMFASPPLQAVRAQGIPTDGLIAAGETIEGTVFLYAPQVKIDGTVDGDVFAISPDVAVSGEITGDLFVLGRTTTIDGILEGNLYAASSRLTLGEAARVARSVYAASLLTSLPKESEVGKDLYLISLGGELSGSVGRDQRAYLGLLEIWNLLFGENDLLRPFVPSDFQIPSSGSVSAPAAIVEPVLDKSPATYMLANGAAVPRAAVQSEVSLSAVENSAVGNWLSGQWQTLAPMLLIGLLLVWLFPRFLQGSTEHLRSEPGNSFLSGLVIFFVCFGVALLALFLILALGLFFSTVKLTDLAWTVWVAGFSTLSVALASFYFSVVYLSKVIVAYLFGLLLLGRIPAAVWGRRIWILLLGEVIVLLLLSIPVLGGILSILMTMFGLGTIYLYLRRNPPPSDKTSQELPVSTPGELKRQTEFVATAVEPQLEESSELSMQPVAEIANDPVNRHG